MGMAPPDAPSSQDHFQHFQHSQQQPPQRTLITTSPSFTSWADNLPPAQGLYDPSLEKDACGVGFMVHIKGIPSHKILADAKYILCNMTHRGATGADIRDGDGAGVMAAIPDTFMRSESAKLGIDLPVSGQYAVGNIFFHQDESVREECRRVFTDLATELGLIILGWRQVPVQNDILGPVSRSKEPIILQPFVTSNTSSTTTTIDFERRLYLLRKRATHQLGLSKWFYICSLSNKNIIYKGQLTPVQVYDYFPDLTNPEFLTHFALVHSRFSTNTFPSWDRAQPMRWCAHNGEINTLRGNKNWMRAREGVMSSTTLGPALETLYPIIEEGGSDSAAFDNVLELMLLNGHELPEAMMMLIPEAWQNHPEMDPAKRAFYEWAACLMEPWDGPALLTFSDGRYVGASLDRNGLRPCRYYITDQDIMICASEVGTVHVDSATILSKGRLQPGKMLLVDTTQGRIVDDTELKSRIATKYPFQEWVRDEIITLDMIRNAVVGTKGEFVVALDSKPLVEDKRMPAFGFTIEQLSMIVNPMVSD